MCKISKHSTKTANEIVTSTVTLLPDYYPVLFEYENKDYLVTVCHFPDWIEIDHLPDTLATTVINCTKAHFARHGTPEICHADNGPQYISKKSKMFSKTYGFQPTRSAPYYPKRNGRTEAAKRHIVFSWIFGKRYSGYLKNTQYQDLPCLYTKPNTFLQKLEL